MTILQHTDLPWQSHDGWEPWEGAIQIVGPGGQIICFTTSGANEKANAAFIVRACNAHDDLVNACKRALIDLGAAKLLAKHTLGEPHGINQTIEIVESALAKVQS